MEMKGKEETRDGEILYCKKNYRNYKIIISF